MGLPVPEVTNHAPVTAAMVASSVAAIAMHYAKVKLGVDFAGLEPHVQVLAVALGYFVAGKAGSA